MKYVKLTAENYNEALKELRTKYGEDAIPISHKYVKEGGLLGTKLFAKEIVELTAAIHEQGLNVKKSAPKRSMPQTQSRLDLRVDNDLSDAFSQNMHRASPQARAKDMASPDSYTSAFKASSADSAIRPGVQSDLRKAAQEVAAEEHSLRKDSYSEVKAANSDARVNHLNAESRREDSKVVNISKNEYNELKKFEKEFYEIKETLAKLMDAQKESAQDKGSRVSVVPPYNDENENLQAIAKILKHNDYSDEELSSLLDEVKSSSSKADLDDRFKIEKSVKELVSSRIVTSGPITVGPRKKIIMFMGPTGVGKTTSLAKMGAHFALRENKKVAFVTIDTYRIAATEQLKKYAEIMRIPIHVTSDQKQFKQVIESEDAEVILVDTSGRSHRNTMKISEIKSFADNVDFDFEKILCISATTKKDDISSICSAFEPLEYTSILITKVDETSFVGNVVKVADTFNKPISYIANGQEVPNDLFAADGEKIADLMMGAL